MWILASRAFGNGFGLMGFPSQLNAAINKKTKQNNCNDSCWLVVSYESLHSTLSKLYKVGVQIVLVCYFICKSRTTPAKLRSSKSMAKGVWPKQKILLATLWNTLSSANSFSSSLKMHKIENNVFTIRSVDNVLGNKFSSAVSLHCDDVAAS